MWTSTWETQVSVSTFLPTEGQAKEKELASVIPDVVRAIIIKEKHHKSNLIR